MVNAKGVVRGIKGLKSRVINVQQSRDSKMGTTTTTSVITKLTKKFLQYNKSIQKRVIVTQDN